MPGPIPEVKTFRTTVDDAIRELNGEFAGFWIDKDQIAGLGNLIFASLDASSDRPAPLFRLPHEGHSWAVILRKQTLGRYMADIAIVSTDKEDAALQRRVGVRSPSGQGHIESARRLDQPDNLAAALRWAQSPHIYGSVLRDLAVLTPDEEEAIGEIYTRERESAWALRDELQRIDLNRRILGEGPY